MKMDFYLTLQSDSSQTYYPENVVTHFRTHLKDRVELRGKWMVGLAEVIYPHTWNNIDDSCYVLIRPEKDRPENRFLKAIRRAYMAHGYYDSVTKIIEGLKHPLRDHTKDVEIFLTDVYHRVIVKKTTPWFDIAFSPQLCQLLGFKPDSFLSEEAFYKRVHTTWLEDSETWPLGEPGRSRSVGRTTEDFVTGDFAPDFKRINELYIYTDIIEPQYVGDIKTQLLRIIKTDLEHGQLHQRSFEKPHYVPLQNTSFQTIEVDIRDALGNPVSFEFGRCTVKLHFKQVRSEYFI